MPRLAALKASTSLRDLATLLEFKPKALSYILYKQPETKKYTVFQIPKRSGGQRTIKAPIDALKLVQRRLSTLLQNCVDDINVTRNRKDRAAHGFKRKRSIITNARQHRHRRYVFNLDLEDFFPSINFGRVRGFFLKNSDFQLPTAVATVIAQIACHENSLPQGSPCSPVISNLVANVLDMRLVSLASGVGCTYSRYADDLTFSTNKKVFPAAIATPSGAEDAKAHLWLPGKKLQKAIQRAGFRINSAKTHLMYRSSRQDVTGLVVNEKINVRREYRHSVRAMVHSLVTSGAFEIYGVTRTAEAATVEKRPGSLNELHGMLGFIDSIDVYNRTNAAAAPSRSFSASEKVYRDFLLYSNFYAAPSPVIICEGATDNVYLTHAIRSLAPEFPDLAEVTDKRIRLKVRLYKYPQSSTARLLDLKDGGSSCLSKFMATYRRQLSHFTAHAVMHPLVILYDNDSGAKDIRSAIRGIFKVAVKGTEPFVRLSANIYALPIPLVGGAKESAIEDCFDAVTKGVVIEGKTFADANNIDVDKHYGKTVFAHKVVRPRADTIDFGGFRPLLANLVAVINAHKGAVIAPQPGV